MSPETRAVSIAVARRFLVLRHLLAPPRSLPAEPASVMRVVDRLGSLQFDPIDVAGRNHDLTLLARIDGYRRAWTDGLLYADRALYETYNKMLSLVPTAELPWYRITWDRHHEAHSGEAFDEHAPLVEELLERIRENGPLSSTDVEPRAAIDWYWRPTNQVRALLEALAEAGVLAIARREGNRRVYDLTERLFPADLLARRVPTDEQLRHKLLSRYRGNGLLGATGEYTLWMGMGKAPERLRVQRELVESGAITPLVVEGFRTPRFAVSAELPILDAAEAEVAGEGGARAGRAAASRARRSSRRSTRSPGTATCCSACSTSTTAGRSTSRRRSAAGATTCCRCCTATGSWAGSSCGSIARRQRSGCWGCGGSRASIRSTRRTRASSRRSRQRCAPTRTSAAMAKIELPRVARHRAFAKAVRARL